VTQLRDEEAGYSMKTLCSLFGKTRHAWYDARWRLQQEVFRRDIVLQEVARIRKRLPALGTRKLHYLLKPVLRRHHMTIGRDYLFDLLAETGMLIKRRRRRMITTDSNHWMRKYDNLIDQMEISRAEQVWVSDITYLRLNSCFVYLSLITDAYSHQIMGYHLQADLSAQGCLMALKMALKKRKNTLLSLIHHSDRGSQYCSKGYVEALTEQKMAISMTQNGDPYENAIAERVNGILKNEFDMERNTGSLQQVRQKLDQVIDAYNNLRPHDSCDYLTPQQAHCKEGKLTKKWKNYYQKKGDLKNDDFQIV
jgi:putative transposase